MNLSNNFTLEELAATSTGLGNKPDQIELQNIQRLVNNVLQPLRDMYGMPIKVNSGFRSHIVNSSVGGASTSQHCSGEAVDIDSINNALLFQMIKDNLIFDQLIWESGNDIQPDWIHVSYKQFENRRQTLRMVNGHYSAM
jgi:zinc D-Ala-D-Ala carboxypeptidase